MSTPRKGLLVASKHKRRDLIDGYAFVPYHKTLGHVQCFNFPFERSPSHNQELR